MGWKTPLAATTIKPATYSIPLSLLRFWALKREATVRFTTQNNDTFTVNDKGLFIELPDGSSALITSLQAFPFLNGQPSLEETKLKEPLVWLQGQKKQSIRIEDIAKDSSDILAAVEGLQPVESYLAFKLVESGLLSVSRLQELIAERTPNDTLGRRVLRNGVCSWEMLLGISMETRRPLELDPVNSEKQTHIKEWELIGEILVARNKLNRGALHYAHKLRSMGSRPLGEILVALGACCDWDINEAARVQNAIWQFPAKDEVLIGQVLVGTGAITQRELEEAERRQQIGRQPLVRVLNQMNIIKDSKVEEIDRIFGKQSVSEEVLGNWMIERMIISPDQLAQAKMIQSKSRRLLGEILVEMGACNPARITEAFKLQSEVREARKKGLDRIGEILVSTGVVKQTQLEQALHMQSHGRKGLSELFKEYGECSDRDIDLALQIASKWRERHNESDMKLGNLLLNRGFVTKVDLEKAFVLHGQTAKPIGRILVDEHLCAPEHILQVLVDKEITVRENLRQFAIAYDASESDPSAKSSGWKPSISLKKRHSDTAAQKFDESIMDESVVADFDSIKDMSRYDTMSGSGSIPAVQVEDPLVGRLFAGNYEILSVIGDGGWGTVYRARHIGLDREVAVKVLHPHLMRDIVKVKRFETEIKAVSKLRHPNVVFILDHGIEPQPFMVMEHIDGMCLRDMVQKGPLQFRLAAEILIGVCRALQAAHDVGIIHRDVKPANIMVCRTKDGLIQIKVLDFGLSKLVLEGGNESLTNTGETLGTPSYMSPEQVRGMPLDPRSDVYAVGCVMHEILTGVRAFDSPIVFECMKKHLNEFAPPVFSVNRLLDAPRVVEDIVSKALAKEPGLRYQSMIELERDVRRALSEASADTRPQKEPVFTWKKRHIGLVGKCAILAVVGYILLPYGLSTAWHFTYDSGKRQQEAGDYVKAENAFGASLSVAQMLHQDRKYLQSVKELLSVYKTAGQFKKAEVLLAEARVTGKLDKEVTSFSSGGIAFSYPENWQADSNKSILLQLQPEFTVLPATITLDAPNKPATELASLQVKSAEGRDGYNPIDTKPNASKLPQGAVDRAFSYKNKESEYDLFERHVYVPLNGKSFHFALKCSAPDFSYLNSKLNEILHSL